MRARAVIALALTIGLATAATVTAKTAAPPSCHLSTSRMGNTLSLKNFVFEGVTPKSNICTWHAERAAGHYDVRLQLDLVPGIKTVYDQARAAGERKAAAPHESFTDLPPAKGDTYKAAFVVIGTSNAGALKPCAPDHKRPAFGPPTCVGDPEWVTYNVSMYGPYKPTGASIMVSVAIGAEYGDTHLSTVRALARDVLLGKE